MAKLTRKQARMLADKHLKGKRLQHSRGTALVAENMGKLLKENSKKLYIAGMLHDIAKPLKDKEMLEKAATWGYNIDSVQKASPGLLHAPLGALILEKEYGTRDRVILDAVAFHTTGRAGMSLFSQILYAADFLDPFRNFPVQEEAWEYMEKDFYEGLFFITAFFLKKILKKSNFIHMDSVHFYNEVLALVNDTSRKLSPVPKKQIINF